MNGVICSAGFNKLSHDILKLLTEEYGDDSGRCLIRTESVLVAYISGTLSEKIRMIVNCFENAG